MYSQNLSEIKNTENNRSISVQWPPPSNAKMHSHSRLPKQQKIKTSTCTLISGKSPTEAKNNMKQMDCRCLMGKEFASTCDGVLRCFCCGRRYFQSPNTLPHLPRVQRARQNGNFTAYAMLVAVCHFEILHVERGYRKHQYLVSRDGFLIWVHIFVGSKLKVKHTLSALIGQV